jgi:hypothetical protein
LKPMFNCFLLEEGKDPDLYPVPLQMQYGVSIRGVLMSSCGLL